MNDSSILVYRPGMKYLTFSIIIFLSAQVFSQASSSSDFQFKVNFDFDIDIHKIQPYYFLKNGNVMEEISFRTNPIDNSIVISGYNDFILWVSFPAICFSLSEDVKLPYFDNVVAQTTMFYLITEGALASYTGEQNCLMKFSRESRVILASLLKHNHDNAFEKIQIIYSNSLPDHHSFRSMIKVNERDRTEMSRPIHKE